MANTKPQVTIFDCESQETIVREATADEIIQMEIIAERAIAAKAAKFEADAKRAALLEKLGITADEAQLLLG